MKRKIICSLSGWEIAEYADYKEAFERYGGNTISNPQFLLFVGEQFDIPQSYYVHYSNGKIDGAICCWGKYIAGDRKAAEIYGLLNLPVNFDEVIPPVSSKVKINILPFHSKRLSSLQASCFFNISRRLNSGRRVCIVKKPSGKTSQTFRRKMKAFEKAGGKINSICDGDLDSFLDIYSELYWQRRGKHNNTDDISYRLMKSMDDFLFGSFLTFNDRPAAAQFITKTEDLNTVYLDYLNSGRDMTLEHYSVGSLCMWVNIIEAYKYADGVGKKLRFNFGPPTHDYKVRWCKMEPLHRVLI